MGPVGVPLWDVSGVLGCVLNGVGSVTWMEGPEVRYRSFSSSSSSGSFSLATTARAALNVNEADDEAGGGTAGDAVMTMFGLETAEIGLHLKVP
jgi:hypothetical protein